MVQRREILVCGATGFIGSHLVAQLLMDGYDNINVISRRKDGCDYIKYVAEKYGVMERYNSSVTEHYGELINYEWLVGIMKNTKILYNCASAVDVSGNKNTNIVTDNTLLTYIIAEAAKECKVDRVIHLSSIAALEVQKYPTITNENHILHNVNKKSPYSRSKFFSENEMWRIYNSGINVSIIAPAVVLGAAEKCFVRSSAAIVDKIRKGVPFYTLGIMGYVLVIDVARAMILASENEKAIGEKFILCTENMTYKDMICRVSKVYNKKAPTIKIPNWFIIFIGLCATFMSKIGIKSTLTLDTAYNLITKSQYDGTKIIKTLNFKYTNIEDGLL